MITGTLVNLKEVALIHLSKKQLKSFWKNMPMLNEKIGTGNPKPFISKVKLLICETDAHQIFHASKEIMTKILPAESGNVEIHLDDLGV